MWTRVIITSNRTPKDWYGVLDEDNQAEWFDEVDTQNERNAFWRRISLYVADINEKDTIP